MTKKDLADMMAEKTGRSGRESLYWASVFIECTKDALERGATLRLRGFAEIGTARTAQRTAFDIVRGVPVSVPPRTKLCIREYKEFRKVLNKGV